MSSTAFIITTHDFALRCYACRIARHPADRLTSVVPSISGVNRCLRYRPYGSARYGSYTMYKQALLIHYAASCAHEADAHLEVAKAYAIAGAQVCGG